MGFIHIAKAYQGGTMGHVNHYILLIKCGWWDLPLLPPPNLALTLYHVTNQRHKEEIVLQHNTSAHKIVTLAEG